MVGNGFSLIGRENCETVSFDAQGGRAFTLICYPDSTGAIPSSLASLLLLSGGAGLFWLWRRQVNRAKSPKSGNSPNARIGYPQGSDHPQTNPLETILLAYAPTENDLGKSLSLMLQDHIGKAQGLNQSSVRTARRPLSAELHNEVSEIADGMVLAAQAGGQLQEGLAHALFVSVMQPLANVDEDSQLPLHRALAIAASAAVYFTVMGGRPDVAHAVAALAGKLYLNAHAWTEDRWSPPSR